MDDEQRKPHLSPSQLGMFLRCPEQWRRRYVEREIIPPGIAAAVGKGYHHGLEVNFRQKLQSHVDLSDSDMVDAAVEQYRAECAGGLWLTPEERSRGMRVVVGENMDKLARVMTVASVQASSVQPVAVEQWTRVKLSGPRDLVGVLDLVDDAQTIRDFKSRGKAPSKGDADGSVQLTAYSVLHRARFGVEENGIELDYAISTRGGKTYRATQRTERGPSHFRALAATIDSMNHAIESGSFHPAAPGSWHCNAKWCGYYTTCAYTSDGQKTLVELRT